MLKLYYQLTKPGIIFGNTLTALAGFLLASKGYIDPKLLISTLIGIALGLASACVFNNYIDRSIDAKMERTKNRALVTGAISERSALIFATVLGFLGIVILYFFTNLLTILLGAVGFFFYEVMYGITKRRSIWSTVMGSISGAMPPVAGYTAVTGRVDTGAILLFLILVFWQLPHFYAIAIYRLKDYKAADLPVFPVVKGVFATKIQILILTIAFAVVTISLSLQGYTGKVYLFTMSIICAGWVFFAIFGFLTKNTTLWARRMFFYSLIANMTVCLLIATNFLLD